MIRKLERITTKEKVSSLGNIVEGTKSGETHIYLFGIRLLKKEFSATIEREEEPCKPPVKVSFKKET